MALIHPGLRQLGGALASALLLLLAEPPFGVLPLAFLALVPLVLSLATLPQGPQGQWQASVVGLVFGIVFWGGSLVWIPLVVGQAFWWAHLGYLLLLVLLGGLSGAFAWALHALLVEKALPPVWAVPLAWVSLEWIKANVPWGLAFPWLGLGVALTPRPEILGLAEWVGERGVAFWLAAVNGLVAGAVVETETGSRLSRWALVGAVAIVPAALGTARSLTLPLVDGPTVATVGTDVPRESRAFPEIAGKMALEQIQSSTSGRELQGVDLVVLPEGTLPWDVTGNEFPWGLQEVRSLSDEWGAPVVFGGMGSGGRGPNAEMVTNSAFLVFPGSPRMERYDKVRLVPGMEAGRYRRGPGPSPLMTASWTLGPLVCYESLFGGMARRLGRDGAEVLLNLSSDVWFGPSDTRLGSFFLLQHPAHLVLRAVENRMPVVRSANGGYTFLLDPRGHRVGPAISPGEGFLRGRLPRYPERTLYSRTGDWVGPTSLALLLMVLLLPRRGLPWRFQG
jgi:apolipoprotein N-acyltransferase